MQAGTGVVESEYNGQNTRDRVWTELVGLCRVNNYMNTPLRLLLIACVASLFTLAFEGSLVGTRSAVAQGYGRGPGDSRSWRDRSRDGGDRGRDRSRDGERRDGERRDDRSDDKPSSSTPTPSSTESKPAVASASASTEKWARDFVTEHDKNGNKWLDGDEKKDLHGRAAESDANNDGVITVEELVAKLTSNAPAAVPATTASGGGDSDRRHRDDKKGYSDSAKRVYTGSAGGLASKSKEGDKRHSYRFSTAADRLPTGLPSFFSRDTNGDGQISMSEYSRTWSKSTVGEFRKYDVNDDGIITAKEAVKPASGS